MMIHNLKSLPEYFRAVWDGRKTFEIRKDDRNFQEGDFVILQEWVTTPAHWNPGQICFTEEIKDHSGAIIVAQITHVTTFEQKPDYVVFAMKVLKRAELPRMAAGPDTTSPFPSKEYPHA